MAFWPGAARLVYRLRVVTPPAGLLDALAVTLRQQIGPAVEDSFAKTQAFMAAVILEKLAGQIRAAPSDGQAETDERHALVDDLRREPGACAAPGIAAALDELALDGGPARWNSLINVLYAERESLEPTTWERLLRRVRVTLRGRLDRQLAYAS